MVCNQEHQERQRSHQWRTAEYMGFGVDQLQAYWTKTVLQLTADRLLLLPPQSSLSRESRRRNASASSSNQIVRHIFFLLLFFFSHK